MHKINKQSMKEGKHKKDANMEGPEEVAVDEEEDDYMSMVIQEPDKPKMKETSIQRRARKEREVRVFFSPMLPYRLDRKNYREP